MKKVLIFLWLVITGCSLSEVPKDTRQMSGKMDQLSDQMQQVVDRVDHTNQGMEKTNSALHQQVLLVALDHMMRPENTRYLLPPTGMMAGGSAFANEATADELVQLAYVWLTEVERAYPEEGDGNYSAEIISKTDRQKLIKITALSVIAGLTPQTTIEDLIDRQVVQKNRYENTVYPLLMLRAIFIKSFLLEGALFSEKITNQGQFAEAMRLLESLEYLMNLPFASRIELKTGGMLDSNNNLDEKLDPNLTRSLWGRLEKALNSELDSKVAEKIRVDFEARRKAAGR